MSDILNISPKNSYLTTKQWNEVVEYVKNRKNISDKIVVDDTVELKTTEEVIEVQNSNAYEQLILTTSVEEMYEALLKIMNEEPQKLYEMTSNEIQVLYNAAVKMNEDAPSDDYQDLVDTLQYLAGDYDLNGAVVYASTLPTSGAISGTYQLASDIQLTGELTVATGATASIDLNGHAITAASGERVITNNGTLTIIDSNPNTVHYGTLKDCERSYKPDADSDLQETTRTTEEVVWIYNASSTSGTKITGGIITGGKSNNGGGIHNLGVLNFNGGSIVGCETPTDSGSEQGGGLYCGADSQTTINGGNILYNWATYIGGGIFSTGATIEIIKGKVDHNAAGASGGGICIYKSSIFTMRDGCSISYNRATGSASSTGNGGGGYIDTSTFNFEGGTISYNKAWGRGGGIDTWRSGSMALTGNCKVIGNTSGYRGGGLSLALYVVNSDNEQMTRELTIHGENVEIRDNIAPVGGGISAIKGNVIIKNGMISGNCAMSVDAQNPQASLRYSGGGVYVEQGTATIEGGSVVSNSAINLGGGVYVNGGDIIVSGDAQVGENTAEYGGGVYVSYLGAGAASGTDTDSAKPASVVISGGAISNNSSTVDGGGAYVNGGTVTMNGGIISDNHANCNGGGAYITNINDDTANIAGVYTMNNGSINDNTAEINGGGIYMYSGDVDVDSGTISSNIALNSGGAIFIANGDIVIGTEDCRNAGESSTHIHPIIEGNIASSGGGIYVNGGTTTMWCGDIKHNKTHEKTVNVLVTNGNFTYNGGSIGVPYDTGVFVTGGVFDDNVSEAEGEIKHELHYYSALSDIIYNGKIPESKWIASPRGDVLHKEDCDPSSPTWADLFPEYEFVGWEQGEDTDEVVVLNAIWEKK